MHRLLESILSQTYKRLEFIFVNDGSTDKTEEIVLSYKGALEEAGIKFIYICQKNKGVAAAINVGLKIFSGEYLCWPDSDDYLEPTSIEKRLHFLENHPQYGCVSSDAYVYDESDLQTPLCRIADGMVHKFEDNQFPYLLNNQTIYCPGCHMYRSSAFFFVFLKREIRVAKCGQNWQMLVPMYYKYKRGFIDEPLFNYLIHGDSLSRINSTKEKALYRCNEYEDLICDMFDQIGMTESDKKKYKAIVKIKYVRERFEIACQHKDKALLKSQYRRLKELGDLHLRDKMNCYGAKSRCLGALLKLKKSVSALLHKIKRTTTQ